MAGTNEDDAQEELRKRVILLLSSEEAMFYPFPALDVPAEVLIAMLGPEPVPRAVITLPGADFFQQKWEGNDVAFYETFRMDKGLFRGLVEACLATGVVERRRGPAQFDVEDDLAATLYYLAHGCTYRVAQDVFRRARSSLGEVVPVMCRAIVAAVNTMSFCRIEWGDPRTESRQWTDAGRVDDTRFAFLEGACCACDGVLIPFVGKEEAYDPMRWIGRKPYPTTTNLVSVRHSGLVAWAAVGMEGAISDSQAWNHFQLHERIPVDHFALCDAGFPGVEYRSLTPYRGTRYHLREWVGGNKPSTAKEIFNLRHSSKRIRVEIAFGKMKARWSILRKGIVCRPSLMPTVIQACMSLHNYLEFFYSSQSVIDICTRFMDDDLREHTASAGASAAAEIVEAAVDGDDVDSLEYRTPYAAWRDGLAERAWIQYQNEMVRRGVVGGAAEVGQEHAALAGEALAAHRLNHIIPYNVMRAAPYWQRS